MNCSSVKKRVRNKTTLIKKILPINFLKVTLFKFLYDPSRQTVSFRKFLFLIKDHYEKKIVKLIFLKMHELCLIEN